MIKNNVLLLILFLLPLEIVFANDVYFLNNLTHNIDSWLNNEMTHSQFITILENYEDELPKEKSYQYYHSKSIIKFYKGRVYFEQNESDKSISQLEECQSLSQKALEIEEKADSWRVMSDAGSLIMIQKGLTYIIANSKKINDYALKSLELDSNNIKASFIVAQGFINAPALFGGNKKKGVKMLNELLTIRSISKETSYYIYITLSKLYMKDKKINEAIESCKAALVIYPGSKKALDLLKELKSMLS